MFKLKRYLKPFLFSILAAFVLLFGQAMCDLKLPGIMADIVNVGIQQSGVENASPEAISKNGFDLIKRFLNEDERIMVDEAYTLVEKGDEAYSKQYALVNESDIYVINEMSEEARTEIDNIYGTATWTFINVLKGMNPESDGSNNFSSAEVDFEQIYGMLPMFEQLPQSVIDEARVSSETLAQSMRNQTGTTFAKMFYDELGVDTSALQTKYIISQGGMMLLITLLGAIATISVGLIASKVAAGVGRNLRKAIFDKVESFSNAEFDKFSASSLITRTTNDITQIQMVVVMGIRIVFYAPIMGIGGIIMIMDKNTSMVWILGLAVALLLCLIAFIFISAMPKFQVMQKLIDRLNLVSRENLSGLMVVRAFGAQEFEEERFDIANKELTKTSLFVQRIVQFMMPCMTIIMNITSLLIVWVGAHQIAASALQVGDMMAFIQYGMQIIMSFLMISMIFILIPRASVSAKRISEVLDSEIAIVDPINAVAFDQSQIGVVEFKNVSFRYNGAEEDVIKNVSFKALPGQTTAFIGSTGSGKSTLINLIPRFYDVSEGQILVNGVDIRQVSQHQLHEQIGYVPQKGVLLSGTIASNLRYGAQSASDEDIQVAAEVAQAKDFIESKEEGYESNIAEGGGNVSGGQKQRLSIARALATKAPIYIFDDSFSALDFKTDSTLRASLKQHTASATLLIVAQRISTIMNAEQILVLDEGEVVGIGTHAELLKSCPTYYEIASSQLSKEEL